MQKVLDMERINRELYTQRIIRLLGKGEVIVLTGHRRVGKSCILECLTTLLSKESNILYLDMENPDNASISDFEDLNKWIKKHRTEIDAIAFDPFAKYDYAWYINVDDFIKQIELFKKFIKNYKGKNIIFYSLSRVNLLRGRG